MIHRIIKKNKYLIFNKVNVIPTDETGVKYYGGDINYDEENEAKQRIIYDPNELLNERLDFKIVIESVRFYKKPCSKAYV